MTTVSAAPAERSRKNLTAILKALSEVGQARVAERLGVSESTVSRMKDTEIERMAAVLSACGLKVVPEDWRDVEPELLRALSVLAARGAQHVAQPSGFGGLEG